MVKNKKLSTQDYEAAFLFNHFINSCHEKAADLFEDEYLKNYILAKRLEMIKNQKIFFKEDCDEYSSNKYKEMSYVGSSFEVEPYTSTNRIEKAHRERKVQPKEPKINYYKLFGEEDSEKENCRGRFKKDRREVFDSTSEGSCSSEECETKSTDDETDDYDSIPTEESFPLKNYGCNEDIKNKKYNSIICKDKRLSKNKTTLSPGSTKDACKENRKEKNGFICGYCPSRFCNLKILLHHMQEFHKTT